MRCCRQPPGSTPGAQGAHRHVVDGHAHSTMVIDLLGGHTLGLISKKDAQQQQQPLVTIENACDSRKGSPVHRDLFAPVTPALCQPLIAALSCSSATKREPPPQSPEPAAPPCSLCPGFTQRTPPHHFLLGLGTMSHRKVVGRPGPGPHGVSPLTFRAGSQLSTLRVGLPLVVTDQSDFKRPEGP